MKNNKRLSFIIRFIGGVLIVTSGFLTTVGSAVPHVGICLIPLPFVMTEMVVNGVSSTNMDQEKSVQNKKLGKDNHRQNKKEAELNETHLKKDQRQKEMTDGNT
jgi:UPF0716 family protein affecting phage T7 exclusion